MSEDQEQPRQQTENYHPLGLKLLPLGTRRGGMFVFWCVVAIAALLVAVDFITRLLDEAPHSGFAGWFGLYGFVMAVFLVMSARLMRIFLKRPENYYDDLRKRSKHDDGKK